MLGGVGKVCPGLRLRRSQPNQPRPAQARRGFSFLSRSSSGQDTRLSTGQRGFESRPRHQLSARSSTDTSARLRTGRLQVRILSCRPILRDRLTVGRLALDQSIEVRILVPQPVFASFV